MAAEITARFMVTTPLFGQGTDAGRPELRLPSFKGMLRFWWRALAWSRLQGNLASIRQEEDLLFGSTGEGQSRLIMRLQAPTNPAVVDDGQVLRIPGMNQPVGEGARYLGYGVMEAFASRNRGTVAGQLTRACLAAPFQFEVQLRGRGLTDQQRQSVLDALIGLGTMGSMGSKSRKGYGSLSLISATIDGRVEWQTPTTMAGLAAVIGSLRQTDSSEPLPEYTALTLESRHVLVSAESKEPLILLDHLGRELVRYRSWGRNGKVLGGDSERRFKDDHDLMKLSIRERKTHPRRVAFGLPHNYGPGADHQVGPAGDGRERRASPMFIHLHQCGDTPVAVVSFLPARFLPHGEGINVGKDQMAPQLPEAELYQPIHEFLDRLLDPDARREPFTDALEV